MGLFDWLNSLIDPMASWAKAALSPYTVIPSSTLFILGASACMSTAVLVINRLMLDVDKFQEYRREIGEYTQMLTSAKEKGDTKTQSYLKRKQRRVSQLQSWMMKQQFKLMFIFFIPFLVIFNLLNVVYGRAPVAFLPIDLPWIGRDMPFFWWYLICSFSVNLPLTRLFGLSFTAED